ncbi:MAG: hypothetical protein FH762_05455 [Firmicutes bacterium]|nr:hypothetical protein [Bacillota bacterium]
MRNIFFHRYNYTIIDFMFFINILLIGSDRLSFSIGIFNIRMVQVSLFITALILIVKRRYILKYLSFYLLFYLSNIISTFFSHDVTASMGYLMWTIYNYIFVFCLFYNWASRVDRDKVLNIWKFTFIIQGIYIILQFLFGSFGFEDIFFGINFFRGLPRPAIWFYEPSYAATYFSIYFSLYLYLYFNYKDRESRNNLLFSFLIIVCLTSTTGFLSIIISFIILFLFVSTVKLKKKVIFSVNFSILLVLFLLLVYKVSPGIYQMLIGRLFSEGLRQASGNRIVEWNTAFSVFKDNWLIGVGPSAYQKYLGELFPPTNVTLEIMANLGLLGLITFLLFICKILLSGFIKTRNLGRYMIKERALIFSFIIFWLTLQANQNYLRLYMWMHLGIMSGIIIKSRKEMKGIFK